MTRDPAPRLLPVVYPAARTCASCRHFDLAAGQDVLRENPYFFAAAQVVSPDRMGKSAFTPQQEGETHEEWVERHKRLDKQLESERTGARWNEFGACNKKQVVLWGADTQPCWAPPVSAIARVAMVSAAALGALAAAGVGIALALQVL